MVAKLKTLLIWGSIFGFLAYFVITRPQVAGASIHNVFAFVGTFADRMGVVLTAVLK
jgi:hypothetical protein